MDEHREHKRRDYVQYNFLFMTEFITERLLHFRLSTAVIILLYNGPESVVWFAQSGELCICMPFYYP